MRKNSTVIRARDAFIELCQTGVFQPGDKLPSELELAERFDVSRGTWRSAAELLQREGILCARHGAGTYVLDASHKIDNDLSQLRSLSEMIKNAGLVEQDSRLSCRRAVPEKRISDMLGTGEQMCCIIQRIRFSEQGSICASVNYIPQAYAADIGEGYIPLSVFRYFERNHITVAQSKTNIFVPADDDPLVSALELPAGGRVLGLRQLHYDTGGVPVLYSDDYLRCDLFNFTITRMRL